MKMHQTPVRNAKFYSKMNLASLRGGGYDGDAAFLIYGCFFGGEVEPKNIQEKILSNIISFNYSTSKFVSKSKFFHTLRIKVFFDEYFDLVRG